MIKNICIQPNNSDIDYQVDPESAVVAIGRRSYISQASFDFGSARAGILIGRYTSIAHRVVFEIGLNHDHMGQVSTYPFADFPVRDIEMNHYYRTNHYQVIIGSDVWIGEGVRILGGVHIGNGAVIGMGSVVTKDVPPYSVVAGNPARVVKYRFDKETIDKLLAIRWWNWDPERIDRCLPEFNDPAGFADRYYEPLKTYTDTFTDSIDEAKAAGGTVFFFSLDFNSVKPLWKQVLSSFCDAFIKDSAMTLIIEVPKRFSSEEEKVEVESYISACDGIVPIVEGSAEIMPVFTHSSVYIAASSIYSLRFTDYAGLYGLETRSAADYESGLFYR